MPDYNPKNERIKKEYFRHLKEAGGRADTTIDGVRKAISRFEAYTGYKDFATFNREQAIAFKKRLAGSPGANSGQPMAKSTLLATTNGLKQFFGWLSCCRRFSRIGFQCRSASFWRSDSDFSWASSESVTQRLPCLR